MTTAVRISLTVEPSDVGHHHGNYSTLELGDSTGSSAGLFFRSAADVDRVIAELVALRNEMEPYAAPRCLAEDGEGWVCNMRSGHDGQHTSTGDNGHEYSRWPIVITDSERDCDEVNPEGHWPCHRGGDHGVHRDSNGDTWRTTPAAHPCCVHCIPECGGQGHEVACQTPDCPSVQQLARAS